jgi:hypothetical protein
MGLATMPCQVAWSSLQHIYRSPCRAVSPRLPPPYSPPTNTHAPNPAGGHLEYQEGFEGCAARELQEETGIEVEPSCTRFAHAVNTVFPDGRHYVTIFMQCAVPEVSTAADSGRPAVLTWQPLPRAALPSSFALHQPLDPTPSDPAIPTPCIAPATHRRAAGHASPKHGAGQVRGLGVRGVGGHPAATVCTAAEAHRCGVPPPEGWCRR